MVKENQSHFTQNSDRVNQPSRQFGEAFFLRRFLPEKEMFLSFDKNFHFRERVYRDFGSVCQENMKNKFLTVYISPII
jgi:hypothetical protein